MVSTLTSANGTADSDELERAMQAIDARRFRLTEHEPVIAHSIFDNATGLWTKYRVTLQFTGKVMGGIPKHPDIVASWLRTKTMVDDDEELRGMMVQTLADEGIEVPEGASLAEIITASKKVASEQHGCGFKKDGGGLYLEGRQPKALLKECTNILYAGVKGDNKWRNGKAPKSCVAEWVFVQEDRIPLGRGEPDGTHLQITRSTGPKGPTSSLNYYDYAWAPRVAFTVKSLEDRVTTTQWGAILELGEEIGLGAMRSQGNGKFKVTAFDKL